MQKIRSSLAKLTKTVFAYGVLICMIAFVIFGLGIAPLANRLPFELVSLSPSKPSVLRQTNPCMPKVITQILHDDSHIYLMYGSIGVVQIYGIDGTYKYTIGIEKPTRRMSQLATHDGYIYIHVDGGNLYVFQEDEFRFYLKASEANELAKTINFGERSDSYSIRFCSIWHRDESGSTCVIVRPVWTGFFQYSRGITIACWFVWMTTLITVLIKAKISEE